jgi:hypothetical protein
MFGGLAKHLIPDPGQLGSDRVGVGEPAVCSSRYQPLRTFGSADGHVLPETRTIVPLAYGRGITKVDTEVDLHAQEVVSGTPGTGGEDCVLRLCEVLTTRHIRILDGSLNPLKLVTPASRA